MSSKFDDIPETTSRFSDLTSEPEGILPPIRGFGDNPLVTLEEAVKPLETIVPEVTQMVSTVKSICQHPKDGLSTNESAAIMLYTLEWTPTDSSFFHILNKNLRSRNRRQLIPWFLYLRLVAHALSKLPPRPHKVIYRGVKMDLTDDYPEGREFFWWSFTSCTSSLGVLETHIGKIGKRTIFNITYNSAIDISNHSYYPNEKEVLFYPARQFKVNSSIDTGNNLHIVHVEEIESEFLLFQTPSNPSPANQNINILLLGEQGVGKSTFINAFVNYLTFETVDRAQSNRPVVIKPLSFVMTSIDSFETHTVQFGDFDRRDPSITKRCQTYTHNLNQNDGTKLCFIDTPSFVYAQKSDQVNYNNIKHILEYVNNLTHLNAVCLLLQPDASRLLDSFQSCTAQLLNRLGANACRNIIFCFTNALMTFSMPGSTAPLLRQMFAAHSMNDIVFNRTNTFFFDNESLRYLIAVQNGIQFKYGDKEEYTSTWSESVNESKRLLNYICTQLHPCRIVKK